MITADRHCHRCDVRIDPVAPIGRRDACPACGTDLHCCLNCRFHDPNYNNHCIENQAERQVDKLAGNFCEFFSFRMRPGADAATRNQESDARTKLDALFKKR